MAKKFGKFLLFTAAVGTAAAAAYYFLKKKDAASPQVDEDDDYDDFSEELEDDTDASSRTYVPLTREGDSTHQEEGADTANASQPAAEAAGAEEAQPSSSFTPLSEHVTEKVEEKLEEKVEEFFDEDESDSSESLKKD